MEKLKYIIEDSTIAEVLGVQNFTNEESAILELVKNAYDAQSLDVVIIISKSQIIIEDNGIGMNRQKILGAWMHVGISDKKYIIGAGETARVLAGSKGVGRFAIARLGAKASVYTKMDQQEAVLWKTDWNTNTLETYQEIKERGTKIVIEQLRDNWTESRVRNLREFLSRTYNDDKMKIQVEYKEDRKAVTRYFGKIQLGVNCVSVIRLQYLAKFQKLVCDIESDEFKENVKKLCPDIDTKEQKIELNIVDELGEMKNDLGWNCDHVRAACDEVSKAVQDEVYAGARAFVKANKGRYDCGGYIYSGDGQELGQFWAKLDVGNAALQKVSSNPGITNGNNSYSLAGATYGVFADKGCKEQLATLMTDKAGNTEAVEVKAGKVYIKELSVPAAGFQLDKTVYPLTVKAGEIATLKVSDTPKVTTTLIELFKIDMETQKDNPQGNASLEGAEFTWKYYDGYYNKDNLPAEANRTLVTKTIAEKDSDGTIHYVTKLADAYKVSGDSFYMQDGKAVLPLGTLTVEETKAPNGYLLDGAYMQAGDKSEQIKGL